MRRTTIDIDPELLAAAGEALRTKSKSETVNIALRLYVAAKEREGSFNTKATLA